MLHSVELNGNRIMATDQIGIWKEAAVVYMKRRISFCVTGKTTELAVKI
jgi:hypothetical protein